MCRLVYREERHLKVRESSQLQHHAGLMGDVSTEIANGVPRDVADYTDLAVAGQPRRGGRDAVESSSMTRFLSLVSE